MNINRQAGRRRGRGGQRQGGGGNPNGNNGNRIDNRARGNASQLLEKYKALAAEAQRQGDRVNTEYYLQFADHYFRVLAETRSRFEEQNPNQSQRRGPENAFDGDDDGYEDDGVEANDREDRGNRVNSHADNDIDTPQIADDRSDRGERFDRNERPARADRGERSDNNDRPQRAERSDRPDRSDREQRPARPRREPRVEAANEGETFDAALLPPSLGISVADEGEAAPKPRRRRARPAEEAADAAE